MNYWSLFGDWPGKITTNKGEKHTPKLKGKEILQERERE